MAQLVTLTGCSCSGKSTIEKQINSLFPNDVTRIISTTSRPRRHDEDQDAYEFTSRSQFIEQIKTNKFVEYSKTNGEFYGIRLETLLNSLTTSAIVVAVVDPNGQIALKRICEQYGINLISVFVSRPLFGCAVSLLKRITKKRTSPVLGLMRLIRLLFVESRWKAGNFDYRLNNSSSLEIAVEQLQNAIAETGFSPCMFDNQTYDLRTKYLTGFQTST